MSKLAKDKGLTLVSLVITIIVLLVLSTIAYHTGKGTINNSRLTAYTAEMTVMQQKVNELAQEYKNGDQDTKSRINSLGTAVPADKAQEASTAFNGASIPQEDREGYKYYSQETLEELGIENVEHDFLVNIQKRSIVSLKGIEYNGQTYYEAADLPNGQYNVEEEDISSTTTFTLSIDVQNGMRIKVNDISYSGNVKAGTVYYGLVQGGQVSKWTKASDQISSTSYSFDVLQEGTYSVKIIDTAGNESDVQSITVNVVNFEVAETGEKFVTLGDAVNKAENNQTVKQIRNYTDSSEVTVDGKSIKFDNNGRTLNRTTNEIIVNSGSTLEIAGSGEITTAENIKLINNSGTLNLTHTGTISYTYTGYNRPIQNRGILNKTGSGIITSSGNYSTIGTTGGNTSIVTISNGKVIAAGDSAIHAYENSKVVINGIAEFDGEGTIIHLGHSTNGAGNLEMLSGTINSSNGSAIYASDNSTVKIMGGTVTGKNNGIQLVTNASATIGDTSSTLNHDNPVIKGGSYGISGGTWNIYNGIIKGQTAAYNTEPEAVRENCSIKTGTETIDGVQYNTAYLSDEYTISWLSGNMIYGLYNQPVETESSYIKYTVNNGTVTVTALRNDGWGNTNGRVYLEAGKTYIFNCETTGIWGYGNDTVEAFLLLNGGTTTYVRMASNTNFEFTPSTTGTYYLRLDVNQNGKTYNFSNISVYEKFRTDTKRYNTQIGTLPSISRTGFAFEGWYTEKTGGTQILDTSLMPANDVSYYTHWRENNYSITKNNETTYFVTLADAFNASASGDTIVHERDCIDTSESTLSNNKSVTFNNNGKTLTKTDNSINVSSGATLNITGSGTITSTNCKVVNNLGEVEIGGTVAISGNANNTVALWNDGNASMTISGGTITSSNYPAIANRENGNMSITGGTITGSYGQVIDNSGEMEVSGTAEIYVTTNFNVIVNRANASLTVTGGTLSGTAGITIKNHGNVEIGGTAQINISGRANAIGNYPDSSMTISGGTISAPNYTTIGNQENTTISITGGTITSSSNEMCAMWNAENSSVTMTGGSIISNAYTTVENHENASMTISGGTITADGYGVVNVSSGFINVTGGTITAGQSGIHNNSGGTINIGKTNSELSTTTPAIRGETYGIEAGTGIWNIYNGIVKGQTAAYDKEPSAWRDNYDVVSGTETIEGNEYKTAYLERSRTFTVTFDKNDDSATGQMEPQVITYNKTEKLNLNSFSKTNYSFLEWNSKRDGSGTTYEDEEEVSNLDNITLYAQWTTKKAEVNGELCDTLQAAIGKVPTDGTLTTVTLLRDTSEALEVAAGKNIKFNLKNFTVSSAGSTNIIKNYGTIEIQNGIISISIAQGAINNYKNLTVSGGKILAPGGRQAIYNDNNSAVVTITGTAYLQSTSLERATVQNNKGTVNIIGGTIISDRMEAVKNSASGTLTIGTLDGDIDITNPVLQGATYGVTSAKAFKYYDGIVKGRAAAFDNENMIPAGNREPDSTIMHNKEEIGEHDYDVAYLKIGKSVSFDPNGGKISQKDSERVVEPGNPIGELPKATKSGNTLVGWFTDPSGGEQITAETLMGNTSVTYYAHWTAATDAAKIGETKYNTLQAAINAVPANDTQTTITLLRDIYETVKVNQHQNVKFDFQSYKLENTVDTSGDNANLLNFGTVLIENGLLISDAEKVAVINNKNTGNLTITGGRIVHRGQRQAIYNDAGTAEITGTAYLESSAPERGTIHNLNNGQLLITGGTIISKKQQAVNNVGSSFTLGIKDGIINQTSPVLQGETFGLTNEKDTLREPTFNFYDGIIKGFNDTIHEVEGTTTIIDTEPGAQQVNDVEYIEGVEYKTTYLQPSRGLLSMFSRRPTIVGTSSITITLNTLVEGANSRTATIEYDSSIISNKKAGFGSTLAEAINNANEATATTVTVTGSGYVYAEGIDSEGNTIASSLQVE